MRTLPLVLLAAFLAASRLLPAQAAPGAIPPAGWQALSAAPVVMHAAQVPRGDLLAVLVACRQPVGPIRVQLLDGGDRRVLEVPASLLGRGGPVRIWLALLGLPSTLAAGDYRVQVDGYAPGALPLGTATASGTDVRLGTAAHVGLPAEKRLFHRRSPLRVLPREFPSERVALDGRLTTLHAGEDPRKDEQARELWTLLTTVDPTAFYHAGAFRLPLPPQTRRTGTFADRRVYEYASGGTAGSVHYGIDFASPTGTPVAASASGVVVLAGERIVTGGTIVLEHLPGLYSLYYHLSSVDVRTGERVEAGQVIGKVGSTGLATGPHLHWEVRAGSVPVDPDGLTRARIIDKTAVLGIIERILGYRAP